MFVASDISGPVRDSYDVALADVDDIRAADFSGGLKAGTSALLSAMDAVDAKRMKKVMVSLLNKAGELGLLSTAIPEDLGGFGKDFTTNTLLTEIFLSTMMGFIYITCLQAR